MKHIPLLLLVMFGLSMCKLTDRLKGLGGSNSNAGSSSNSGGPGGVTFEHPNPTTAESAAIAGGQTAKSTAQRLMWTAPSKCTNTTDEKLTYGCGRGQTASMDRKISVSSDAFPV